MASKKKTNYIGISLFMIVVAAAVIGGYLYITRPSKGETVEAQGTGSEAAALIAKDLFATDYPQTPREVVKLYSRITKCLYNDELSSEQLKKLVRQVRNLYSIELIMENPEDDMIKLLSEDIDYYRKNGMLISSYSVDAASKVNYIDDSTGSRATINMSFNIRQNGSFQHTYERFVLKKDDSGRWRILGWQYIEPTNIADTD